MSRRVQFQVQFRKSSPATKIVASVAIVLSILALIALGLAKDEITAQVNAMRSEAAPLEAENQRITDRLNAQDSIVSVQQIAQEELGLVDPDTVIIETD